MLGEAMRKKLTTRALNSWLKNHDRWSAQGDAITRTYSFSSFRSAIVFVNRVATIADELNHHPDIAVRYTKVDLRLSSHDAGGVTERDLGLAERIDVATSAR